MKKYIIKYLLESIVLVTGITISFWINQISIDKETKGERSRVINSLLSEVEEIEKYSLEKLKIWNQDVEIYSQLLKKDIDIELIQNIAISKSRVEYNLIYYRDFSPPNNRYESMVNTGALKFINSEKITDALTRLHNQDLNMVKSTVEYEKSLKTKLINILTSKHPKIILAAENNEVSLSNYLNSLNGLFQRDQEVRTELLIQMRYFKTRISSLKYYLITLDELKDALKIDMKIN
ncbi:hypothetical protein N8971_00190 [Flavobacteriaceae bacterium]|nr:hypothetical protein [Flavobacteriaceae bacterium]MDC0386578.1 hypothetical protein [Flavobacteriaceae bacterium]